MAKKKKGKSTNPKLRLISKRATRVDNLGPCGGTQKAIVGLFFYAPNARASLRQVSWQVGRAIGINPGRRMGNEPEKVLVLPNPVFLTDTHCSPLRVRVRQARHER